ncbi:MAG: hypothetical protein HY822_08675 [Acidobacteria bacterium]|nr:hypothetical protein [Acidobacteriota bacterium]
MGTHNPTRLLVVGSSADELRILRLLFPEWIVCRAKSASEAQVCLQSAPVTAILTERDLPDGGWKDVLLSEMPERPIPPAVVISAQADDRLWSEVLNLGGHDVLLKPLDPAEVLRVLHTAVRRSACA